VPWIAATTIADLRRFIAGNAQSRTAEVGRRVPSLLDERQGLIDESCVVASHAVAEALRAGGFHPVIVEEGLSVGSQSLQQNRIVVIELTEQWLVIDLAVRQVPAFCSDEIFWAVISPELPR